MKALTTQKTTTMQRRAHLVAYELIAANTAMFRFELSSTLDSFDPGQACEITLLHPSHHDTKGDSRTLSLASSPRDLPEVVVATRLTGSAFKRSLMEGGPIDATFDGPFGSFTLSHNQDRPVLLLAGGIGITPFRSMIKDATERQSSRTIRLLYSNRSAASTAFLAELGAWQRRNEHFTLVATLTDPAADPSWPHHRGRIDSAFLRGHLQTLVRPTCYVAGPAVFTVGMRQALVDADVDPDDIRVEEFPGY